MTLVWGAFRPGLVDDFADACDATLGTLPDTWVVTSGVRSSITQAALYAQGRTTPGAIVTWAPPGTSPHEFGLAIDVELQAAGVDPYDESNPAWPRLWDAIRASSTLHSGQDFPKGEQDGDHIERFNWRAHESDEI